VSDDAMHWYGSKVDWWLGAVLVLAPLVPLVACIALAASGKMAELPIGIGVFLFVAALYGGLVVPVKYGLGDGNLVVRFGLCRVRVPLADVSEVHPTRNPLSSPALSLDRLYVKFGEGFSKAVMISPENRDQFLDDFARQAGLTRDGDRLVRK
jgi:hypothetical protein